MYNPLPFPFIRQSAHGKQILYTQQMHETEHFISTTAAAYLFIQYSRFRFSTDNWIAKFLNKHAMRTAVYRKVPTCFVRPHRCIENNRKVGDIFH